MITLEIGGQPTAIMNADEEDARAILEADGFQEDLKGMTTDGVPVWDGKAPLNLRASTPDEIAAFEESEEEDEDAEEDEEDSATILFLVPLDDDEDEDGEDEV